MNTKVPSVDVWGVNVFRGATFGELFDQWESISSKPMFIGEFGTDAFNQKTAAEDQATQASFNAALWDEIAENLSANDPQLVAIGGLVFEWNDEWWKAGDPLSHDIGGFAFASHPDGFANEEWFGCGVDIDRNKRQCFFTFQTKFAEDLEPLLSITPTSLDFGLIAVRKTSKDQIVTVRNDRTANVGIGVISLGGADANQFARGSDRCSKKTLAPGRSCTVAARFKPTSNGAKTANLIIPSNNPNESPFNVVLSGDTARRW